MAVIRYSSEPHPYAPKSPPPRGKRYIVRCAGCAFQKHFADLDQAAIVRNRHAGCEHRVFVFEYQWSARRYGKWTLWKNRWLEVKQFDSSVVSFGVG